MRKKLEVAGVFLLCILMIGIFCSGQSLSAQTTPSDPQGPTEQGAETETGHSANPKRPNPTAEGGSQPTGPKGVRTFTGVIARSGDKFVLTDPLLKISYQLDNQRRAQELANKNVKVTGVLDPSTGTIHVRAIDPNGRAMGDSPKPEEGRASLG